MKIFIFLEINKKDSIYYRKANYINTINMLKGFYNTENEIYTTKDNNFNIINKLYDLDKLTNLKFIKYKNIDDIINFIINNNIKLVYNRCETRLAKLLLDRNYNGKIVQEQHGENRYEHLNDKNIDEKVLFITISKKIKNKLNYKNTIVYPCSVNYPLFSKNPTNLINFKHDFNICYSGHIYPYKGIPLLLEAAKKLPNIGFQIVGGFKKDIKTYKPSKNVTFHGFKKQSDVVSFLYSSDILILPYSKFHYQSSTTSPVKLFEYLSTGKPVLSSNIDGIKNWGLNYLEYFEADNIEDLLNKIKKIKDNYIEYYNKKNIEDRKFFSKKFSNVTRANKIIEF